MMEKMMAYGYPPSVNKFRPEQIMQANNWDRVENGTETKVYMHQIHIVPDGATTCTYVNPLDSGDEFESYRAIPHSYGPVIPARKMC